MQASRGVAAKTSSFVTFLTGGLIAGVTAAVINNLFFYIYATISGASYPEVNLIAISISSVITNLVGALVYYGLSRFTARATTIFVVGGLVLGVLSIGSNLFAPPHPNPGFAIATVPMHLIAAIACVTIVPRMVRGER